MRFRGCRGSDSGFGVLGLGFEGLGSRAPNFWGLLQQSFPRDPNIP